MAKFLKGLLAVIKGVFVVGVVLFIMWAFTIYGQEFKDDTENFIDNVINKQEQQEQTPETEENTEEPVVLTVTYDI